MKKHNPKFKEGFDKTAHTRLPDWLRNAHLSMQMNKSHPAYSKHGIRNMLKRRGLK